MQSSAFYFQHLEQVSRSFSFCIAQLLSPAKKWVALSYLLCRVADIIEDSKWIDKTLQYEKLEQLKYFLTDPPTSEQFSTWLHNIPAELALAERNLLIDLPLLLNDAQELPNNIRTELNQTFCSMVDGMIYFLQRDQMLFSLAQTNCYCFFVAGLIGEWLTYMFTDLLVDFKWTEQLLIQSFHFGLFLQKINMLKDQLDDEAAGRFYVSSSRTELRASLWIDAQASLSYLQSIPIISGRTYRLFCAWSLFIGLASLKWIDKSWQMNEQLKIGRRETHYLMKQISDMIDDNYALERLFHRYTQDFEFNLHNK